MDIKRRFSILVLAALIWADAGCGSNSAAPPPPPPPATPTPTPIHVYLSQGSVYTLPLTSASTPTFTIAASGLGMAFDNAHRLFVARADGTLQVFTAPLGSAAVPAFTFASGLRSANDVAVDSAGDLMIAGDVPRLVCFFKSCHSEPAPTLQFAPAPVSASTSAALMYEGLASFFFGSTMKGVAIDANGDVWSTNGHSLYEFTPPIGPAATVAASLVEPGQGIAFDSAGRMFVSTAAGIDVFQPPFSSAMTKAFSISEASQGYLAFDPSGNLYVSTTNGQLLEFIHPLSAASTPAVTLSIPGGGLAGIAIGP